MAFDHAQSPRLGQPTPVENPGVRLVTVETLPEIAYAGQIVYLLDRDEFRVHDGVAWQNPTAAGTGGTQTFVGATAPAADSVGDLWMNTTTYQLYAWDGTAWKPAVDPVAQAAALAASNAQVKAEQALGLVAGKTTIWYLPTQPAPPDQVVTIGDYWINTVTNSLYKFDTLTTVIPVQDADIANALNQAGSAQATADQKIETYTVLWADRPLDLGATGIGDILFAVDQGNASYRWDGSDWVALSASTVSSVTVTDGFALSSGAVGHVESQSSMVLDGQVTPPSTPPTYSHFWPSASFVIPDYFVPSWTVVETRVGGLAYDTTYMYVAINLYNSGRTKCLAAVYRFLRSTGAYVDKHNYSVTAPYEIKDIAVDSTYLHIVERNAADATRWLRRVVKSTMSTDGVSRGNVADDPAIGLDSDGTNVWLLRQRGSDSLLELSKYDLAYNFVDTLFSTKAVIGWATGVEVGTFPGISGQKVIAPVTFDSTAISVQSFTMNSAASTLTLVTGDEFESSPATGAFSFDGANFQQTNRLLYSDVLGIRKFSNDTSTTTRWVSTDYRAISSATGANMYRTPPGPKAKLVPIKRATLQITAPQIPPDPNPGVDGDVNGVGIYIGSGTTEPGPTGMWLQTPEQVIGSRTLTVGDTGPILTGTHPVTNSTFPAGIPGLISSSSLRFDATPKNYIDGAGGARLDGLLPPGSMTAYAGTVAPAGWHKCDGAGLSTTAYPDLFAVLNYSFGGSGTIFNLPTISPGTGLMWLIKL